MFKDINSNEKAKSFLKNELKIKKSSATYLFYGKKESDPFEMALAMAKGLLCNVLEDDFCGECSTCKRIDSRNLPDLSILGREENIGIKDIRDIIYKASSSSYEGHRKVFIIDNVQKMNKESSNALLKTTEEPEPGTFFILITNTLNIIPTILSRSIRVDILQKTHSELDVTKEEYDFFLGNNKDIMDYKNTEIDLRAAKSYKDIRAYIKSYIDDRGIESKVDLYKGIRDFIEYRKELTDLGRVFFAQEVYGGVSKDRSVVEEILYYIVVQLKESCDIERALTLKSYIKSNVNLSLLLKVFFREV